MNIGIANDMIMAAEQLRRILAGSPKLKVVWIAKDGREAVNFCRVQKPDLILMDLIMPGMNGVEATRAIMQNCPCPILVVSAHNDDSAKIFEAISAGAVDATPLPSTPNSVTLFLKKINEVVHENVADETMPSHLAPASSLDRVIVIGASAGGPAALAEVLKPLPVNFPIPIVIVQHIGSEFIPGLVDWLKSQTALPVQIACKGDVPAPGRVLVAGTGDHLIFSDAATLGYTSLPADSIHRPSIDVFFKSVAQKWPGEATGILLTGMGRDGAAGLKMMRNKGHLTIAQDQATSVVYGMPKAAAALGAAVEILPLPQIASRLLKLSHPQNHL